MTTTKTLSTWTIADGLPIITSLGPYTNEANRLAATQNAQAVNFSAVDVGRIAQQSDTGAMWVIESVTSGVPRWRLLAGPAPISAQSGTSYTLVTADMDHKIILTNGSAIALTIPLSGSGFPIKAGDSVRIKQGGAGAVTVAGASGVTPHASGTLVTGGQYSELVLECEFANGIADVWAVFGRST